MIMVFTIPGMKQKAQLKHKEVTTEVNNQENLDLSFRRDVKKYALGQSSKTSAGYI